MRKALIITGILLSYSLCAQDESWTIVEKELPLSETFEAGTRVVFTIPYEGYTVVNYTEVSVGLSKVIFHAFENGTPIPDEKIGPPVVRTRELDPGEKLRMVYSWSKGNKIHIEILEGKVQLEISEEQKTH